MYPDVPETKILDNPYTLLAGYDNADGGLAAGLAVPRLGNAVQRHRLEGDVQLAGAA